MIRSEILERSKALQSTPILDRLAAMREMLTKAGDEAQELRHLPAWAAKELANAGMYRFVLPRELGGEELSARQQIEVVEAASAIDGSVGWCVHINSEINGLVIRRMDRALVDTIFNDWDVLVCSGLGPPNGPFPGRKARRDGAGWQVAYQGSFASGCHNATWNFIMASQMKDEDTGEAPVHSFMIPRGEFEIVDTWNVAGMRGSGSHDVRIVGYVPPEHLLPADALGASDLWDSPTYRNPTHATYNKAACALGVAKGTIDTFIDLTQRKTPWGLDTMLKDMPQVQYRVGEAIATYKAARAFVMDTQDALEADLGPLPSKGGNMNPRWETLREANLACAFAAQTCRKVVDELHNTSGTTGARLESPLERQLRDGHQAATHALISWRHLENLGKTWLGYDPPANYVRMQRA